jgi:hypothetical protein
VDTPDGNRPRVTGWTLAASAVGLAVVVAHIRFAAIDGRPPVDLNRSYQLLPDLYAALGESGRLGEALKVAISESNGAYNLLLAALMRTVGRSFALMDVFDVGWVAVILIAVWAMARRLSGPPAALAAVARVGNAAGVVLMGRQGWIHVPELALISLVLAVLVGDPGLDRRRSVAAIALAGAVALTLRPSALIWIGTLVPVLAWGFRDARSRRRHALRLGAIALVWAIAAAPTALAIREYLGHKLSMRGRYEAVEDTPGLLHQWSGSLALPAGGPSLVAAALGLLGVAVAVVAIRRLGPRFVVLLLLWLGLPLLLQLYFVTGPEDFPVIVVALAVLGGAGLARLHRWAPVAVVVLWFPSHLVQWLPPTTDEPGPGEEEWREDGEIEDDGIPEPWLLLTGMFRGEPQPGNHYLPYPALHHRDVLARVDAACGPPSRARCTIDVYHGLFHPFGEAPGDLALFLAGRDHVEVLPVWSQRAAGRRPPSPGYARYTCDDLEDHWRARFPELADREARILADGHYREVWSRELPGGCRYAWFTPGGVL